jgi:O-antigen/teichoic acid export membrane protein
MRELLNNHLLEVAAAKIVPALAGIGFVAVAARYCAPADYGLFALGFATANLMAVVSVVWISQAVLRYAGNGLGVAMMKQVVSVAIGCAVLLGLAAMAFRQFVTWPGAARPLDGADWAIPLLAVALALNTTVGAYATALQQFRAYRVAEVFRGILVLVLVFVAAALHAGATGLVLAYASSLVFPSIALMVSLAGRTSAPATTSLPKVLVLFLQYGWPMTLWAGLQATQALIERNVLGTALAPAEFGRFMATTDVVMRGIGLVLMPVVTYVHARLMATAGHGTALDLPARKLLRSGRQLVLIGGAALTSGVFLARPLLVHIAPGIGTIDNLTLLMLCLAAIAWTLALIVHKPLELSRLTLRMSMLLALAVGLEWALLSTWVGTYQERAMPMASCVAALIYMAICSLPARASTKS